jgi:hypothetical protein
VLSVSSAALAPTHAGQSLRSRIRAAARLRTAAARISTPVLPVLHNLASIPLTVAGLGCVDAAAFVGNTIAGLVVTGLSLIGLEYLIADEQ